MAVAGVFLIGILYIFIQYIIKEDAYSVIYKYGLILSQVYGIVILVFLLGYGLAQFPSYMWYKSNNQLQLNMTIATTEKKFNQFRQAKAELYEACDLMQQLIDKIPTFSELSVYKDKIIQEIPNNDEIRDAFSGGSISKTKVEISQSEKNSQEKEQSLVLSLKALRDVTEDSVAQARAILIRKKLNYIVAYNVWHKHLDKFSSLTNKDQIMQLIEKKNQLKKSTTKNSLSQTLLQKKMNSKDKKKLKKEQEKKDKKNKKQKKEDKKNKNKLQENFIEKGETIDINLDTQEESKQEFAMCYVIMMTFGQLSSQESNTNFSSGFNTFFLPLKNSSVIGKYYDKVVSISISTIGPQKKENLEKHKKKPNKSFARSITSLFSSKKQKDPQKNNQKSDLNQTEIGLKNTENLSTSQSNIDFNNKNIFNLSNINDDHYEEKNYNENIDEKEFQTRPREKAFSEFRMRSKPVSENHLTIANSLNQDKISIDGNQDTILFKNLTKLQQLEE
ncbi:hypothetical protein PPERSA_12750 [Pseudocohnilembus persalinus]|uniref:Transmembrane protein n=1 Tax=Pseudocohnilembus persalinus TaxID=266149 RepID=A0A0V0QTK5_PSEPJ|nr:hypothetical protein PPERSA_12750 [Pseudocohnilembus persalinus]|eukprot:KRX05572.1 hypothetical protein PPERSA_12750 [Pseudocohnilembus persalinus]